MNVHLIQPPQKLIKNTINYSGVVQWI